MKKNEYLDNELVSLYEDCEAVDEILQTMPLSTDQRHKLVLLKDVISDFMFKLEELKS